LLLLEKKWGPTTIVFFSFHAFAITNIIQEHLPFFTKNVACACKDRGNNSMMNSEDLLILHPFFAESRACIFLVKLILLTDAEERDS
jgi:hypothetical protein